MGNRDADEGLVHRQRNPGTWADPLRVPAERSSRAPVRRPCPRRTGPRRARVAPRRDAALVVALVIGLTVGLLAGLAVGGIEGGNGAAESPAAATRPPVAATPTVLNSMGGDGGRWVALTFDDGPDSRYTPEVLALLQRHDAVATFCMVGNQIPGNETLIRQVAAAGMALCSHTRTHDRELPGKPLDQIINEIVGAQRDLAAVAGVPVGYYRAPGGNWSPAVLEVAALHDMQPLGWSVDTRDWTEPGVEAILEAVDRQLQPGGVILLHDGGGNREQTVAALAVLLPRLVELGYQFGFPAVAQPAG